MSLHLGSALIGSVCALASIAAAQAQYPDRAIRFVVPFPPGGGTDTMARAISGRLAEALGQQVVIDNRGGGPSVIALVGGEASVGFTTTPSCIFQTKAG